MSNVPFPSLPGVYIKSREQLYSDRVDAAYTGPEFRSTFSPPRYRYTLAIAFLRPWLKEHVILDEFFKARRGRADSFLFTDTWDADHPVVRRCRFDEPALGLDWDEGVYVGEVSIVSVVDTSAG